jgi:3-hydroxyacyl-[acyl-carrier-protein] dehydratase
MHFINDLFSVTGNNVDATSGNFTLSVNATHPVYQGHFPGNPITPGVCSMEMLKELTETYFSWCGQLAEVKTIKFLSFINPLATAEITADLQILEMSSGIWRVRGMLCADEKPAVKVVMRYELNASQTL